MLNPSLNNIRHAEVPDFEEQYKKQEKKNFWIEYQQEHDAKMKEKFKQEKMEK